MLKNIILWFKEKTEYTCRSRRAQGFEFAAGQLLQFPEMTEQIRANAFNATDGDSFHEGVLLACEIHEEAASTQRVEVRKAWAEGVKESVDPERYIALTPAEIQSKLSRVRWAEGLIRQLPAGHDGRNSWLLNYGTNA